MQMFKYLDMPGRHAIGCNGGGVNWSIVQKEKTLSCRRYGPFLLENLYELAQGLHNVVCVHHGPPGHEVGVDEALVEEEGEDHLFGPGQMELGLDRPRQALLQPLFGLLLGFRSVEGHSKLVHGNKVFHHHLRAAANHRQESLTGSHTLHLHLLGHKLGDPSCRLVC